MFSVITKGEDKMQSLLPANGENTQSAQNATTLNTALFQQIAAGDKEAFHMLYQETSKSVYVFLLSIV